MSQVFKLLCFSFLLFLGKLPAENYVLETVSEPINRFPHKFGDSLPSHISFLANDKGEVVWEELNPVRPEFGSVLNQMFYWSEDAGRIEIDIDDEMHRLGYRRRDQGPKEAQAYCVSFRKLDENGNVFFAIGIDLRKIKPDRHKDSLGKIGIWNKKFGFKMINIPNIDYVEEVKFSSNLIFVRGENAQREESFVVLRPVNDHWPWEVSEGKFDESSTIQAQIDTPWDGLLFGKHSKRLNIIQKLLKKTKSSTEKNTLTAILLSEIALVKDKLQYDLKRAQWGNDKAHKEGKVDSDAEKTYSDTQKHLIALESYIKGLSKTDRCKIAEIDLPSKRWIPSER